MNIKISKERKLAQFIGVPIFVSVLLLFNVFAAPAYSEIVLGTIDKAVEIDPPSVAEHADLAPYDPPVFFVNHWKSRSVGLDEERKKVEALWRTINAPPTPGSGPLISRDNALQDLRDIAKKYIEKEKSSADKFWWAIEPLAIKLNPPQGSTVSTTWDHCYTLSELKAYKREAIRWAHYILDVYLPKNFPNFSTPTK